MQKVQSVGGLERVAYADSWERARCGVNVVESEEWKEEWVCGQK